MSIQLKLVIVDFIQHCIQCTLYSTLYTGHLTLPTGKSTVLYCLLSCWFTSQSQRRQLCLLSGTCQLQGWLQAKCLANPQFLKTKGVLSNPVILKCKEKSCILHTVRLPDYILKIQKVLFSASRMAAFEVGQVQSENVGSYEQRDMPIQQTCSSIEAKDTSCP